MEAPAKKSPSFNRKPNLKYSLAVAKAFCSALANSESGLATVLKSDKRFPSISRIYAWAQHKPAFARRWENAKAQQAELLMQKILDLAKECTPKNAHAIRVKFDIYKFRASKIIPAIYGDKPATSPQLSVQTQIVIAPQRLELIRQKLERSRNAFAQLIEQKHKTRLSNDSFAPLLPAPQKKLGGPLKFPEEIAIFEEDRKTREYQEKQGVEFPET